MIMDSMEEDCDSEIMKPNDENPWNIKSVFAFQYFNCPSCLFKDSAKQTFVDHAIAVHPESIAMFSSISDGSLDDIDPSMPNAIQNSIEDDIEIENDSQVEMEDVSNLTNQENILKQDANCDKEVDSKILNTMLSEKKVQNATENADSDKKCQSPLKSVENQVRFQTMKNQGKNSPMPNQIEIPSEQNEVNKSPVQSLIKIPAVKNQFQFPLLQNQVKTPKMGTQKVKNPAKKNHVDIPDVEEEFDFYHECRYCSAPFTRPTPLVTHLVKSHGGKCNICGEMFKIRRDLKTHIDKMHDIYHICRFCQVFITKPKNMVFHLIAFHDGKCNICGNSKKFKRKLNLHYDEMHSQNDDPVERKTSSNIQTGQLKKEIDMVALQSSENLDPLDIHEPFKDAPAINASEDNPDPSLSIENDIEMKHDYQVKMEETLNPIRQENKPSPRVLPDHNPDLKVSYALEHEKIEQNPAMINDCFDKKKSLENQVQIPLVENELEILPKQNQVKISSKKNENISERQDHPDILKREDEVQNQVKNTIVKNPVQNQYKNPTVLRCNLCNIPYGTQVGLDKHNKKNHSEQIDILNPDISFTEGGKPIPSKKSDGIIAYEFVKLVLEPKILNLVKDEQLKCPICQAPHTSPRLLKWHIGNIHGFECKQCKKSFQHLRDLEKHVSYIHGDGVTIHKCHQCSEEYRSPREIEIHTLNAHDSRSKNHQCDKCEKSYYELFHLNLHIKNAHDDIRDWKCGVCDKRFHSKNEKLIHEGRSHGPKSIVCDLCGKLSSDAKSNQQHVEMVHEKKKCVQCDACGKGFYKANDLKRHVDAVHKGLKPFECKICNKAFAVKQKLKEHFRTISHRQKEKEALQEALS